MAKKEKYYVVWKGITPGIYETWRECEQMIKNYPDARYKSFTSLAEAEYAYKTGPYSIAAPKITSAVVKSLHSIVKDSIAVDAGCEGNPGRLEYQGVNPHTGEKIFHMGPFEQGTNNIGEFLAIVHALALLRKKENQTTAIYSDSITAISWVRNKRIKTNLQKNSRNEILFTLMDRAMTWLNTYPFKNKILKWETEEWGENPADFGRK
jgi:ribonuclease HI